MFDVYPHSGTFDSNPDTHHQIHFWCLPLTCLYTVVSKCQHDNISSHTSKSMNYIQLLCWTWLYWLTVSEDMKNFIVIMTIMVVHAASLYNHKLDLIREEANKAINATSNEVRKLQNCMWLAYLFYNILTILSCLLNCYLDPERCLRLLTAPPEQGCVKCREYISL